MAPKDNQCQMRGCTREADRRMSFNRHEDIAVCTHHYRRNKGIRYAVMVALLLAFAALGLGVHWLFF